MEVMIFSQSIERRNKITHMADNVIAQKRLRLMSINTAEPKNADELIKNIKPNKGYLVIMDIICFPDWKKIIGKISEKFHYISFCLISNDNIAAAEAINSSFSVCGYINTKNTELADELEKVLTQIYARVSTVCRGIMTSDENGALKIIDFNDIYYIETIKQQHRCTVYHKNGSDVIRADISKLIKNLDGRFEITRSSTIANLSMAKSISDGMICFENGDCCSIAAKRVGEIKKTMLKNVVI